MVLCLWMHAQFQAHDTHIVLLCFKATYLTNGKGMHVRIYTIGALAMNYHKYINAIYKVLNHQNLDTVLPKIFKSENFRKSASFMH